MLRFDAKGALRVLVHVAVAFSVFFSAAFSIRRTTELGIQCPTAVVQKVVETIKVPTACGCIVEKKVVRAPRLGEREFKQCECAEKKSSKGKTQNQSGEPITWFFSRPVVPIAGAIRIPHRSERFHEGLRVSGLTPLTPPPLSV